MKETRLEQLARIEEQLCIWYKNPSFNKDHPCHQLCFGYNTECSKYQPKVQPAQIIKLFDTPDFSEKYKPKFDWPNRRR